MDVCMCVYVYKYRYKYRYRYRYSKLKEWEPIFENGFLENRFSMPTVVIQQLRVLHTLEKGLAMGATWVFSCFRMS